MHPVFIFGLFVMSVVGMTAVADDAASFKITSRRDNDKVVVRAVKTKVVFSIQSPFGISNTTIERMEEKWPDSTVLRLHLRGLENLLIKSGKVNLEASMSSQNNTVRVWEAGKEESPLDTKSPYWMEVRKLGIDGKPTKAIPLKTVALKWFCPKHFLRKIRNRFRCTGSTSIVDAILERKADGPCGHRPLRKWPNSHPR